MRATQTKPDQRDERAQHDGRQIVICCDGTSNTLSAGVRDTNVVRLVDMLTESRGAPDRPDQIVYYDPGVGAPRGLPPTGISGFFVDPLRRALELGVGRGIYENVGEAYLFLSREYGRYAEAGQPTADQIYIFGFSRGAFTARCVAGMVSLFGLVRAEHEHLLPTLLNVYFAAPKPPRGFLLLLRQLRGQVLGKAPLLTRRAVADQVRELFTTPAGAQAQVHFLGVWDTVQSVGIPGLRKTISSTPSLKGKHITHVRHALSIDEHRRQFLPRYFSGPLDPDQTLSQRWFRGVHSDIGGGRRSPLADATFRWMVQEAEQAGLKYTGDPSLQPISVLKNWPQPDRFLGDQLYVTPWWALTGMAVRDPSVAWSGDGAWELTQRAGANPPAEHESVEGFSPPPGRKKGPTAEEELRSPWEVARPPRSPRRIWALLGWGLLAIIGLVLAGLLVEPQGAGRWWPPGELPAALRDAIWSGMQLEWAQLSAIVPRGLEIDGQLVDAHNLLLEGRNTSWGLLATTLPLAGWTYVMARIATRAFRRAARWRRVGPEAPEPRLRRGRIHDCLGNSIAIFAGGAALSIVLHLASTWMAGFERDLLLVLGGVAAWVKWAGVIGTGLLLVHAARG